MKVVLGILLGLACGVGLWLLVEAGGGTSDKAPPTALAPGRDDAHVTELERRVASLESEMQRIGFEIAQQSGTRSAGTQAFVPTPADVKRSGDGVDPRWYLQEYARSFDTTKDGSEYFRLAVDAYAPMLLNEICDIVRESAARSELRSKLAQMLGTPRFARNGLALDALFAMLRNASGDALALNALDSLGAIGDAQTGIGLERLIWTFTSLEVQKKILATIVQLVGPDANRALQRLLASATTSEARQLVIGALSTADPDAALEVLRLASTLEDPVRLRAAHAIQKFRGEAFLAFVDEWLSFERDEQVRQVLNAARGRLTQIQPYAAAKATGPPDAVATQDHPNAWASQSPDMGVQWLELSYKPARRANAARIHEVYVPGAVSQIFLYDEAGGRHEVWSGVDPTSQPGVFEVTFATTSYSVKAVRIVLDTNRRPGWSEIDAVELVGPDGSAWATDASASSSYGQ